MASIERFADLMRCGTLEGWRNQVFRMGSDLGYEQTRLAILPDPNAPVEAENAFQHSNYSPDWFNKYTAERMHHVDPTFAHCISKSIPLIWSPDIFSARKQKEMYEEACGYGIRSGVTLPIHGAKGELGIVCFVSDIKPDKRFQRDTYRNLAELSCLRDFIFESSLQFMKPLCPTDKPAPLTLRELECLKWSAAGKSSWEIGQILHCTEATANYHFSNLRRKFNTTSRQQAVVRAINLGLINPV
jgi:LuxR family quorum-sensing transcriptional regulator LasR